MLRFLGYRLMAIVPVLLGVSLCAFLLMRLVPGDITLTLLGPFATPDAQAAMRAYYGLDQPLWQQYLRWLGNALVGDFGRSVGMQMQVSEVLGVRVWNTVILTFFSALIAIGLGALGGALAGIRRFSLYDRASTLLALVISSAPTFWFALLLLWLFALELRWLPATGMYSPGKSGDLVNLLLHVPLPAFSASLVSLAVIFRLTRSGMIDVMTTDFVRAARARGIPEGRLLTRHAMRAVLPGLVNISGLQVGFIFGSALFAEVIFQWPGVGLLMYGAIQARDVPMIQAVLLVISVVFVLANLVSDLVMAALSPQARLGAGGAGHG
jgi:peptide/nickel transport system permease protein